MSIKEMKTAYIALTELLEVTVLVHWNFTKWLQNIDEQLMLHERTLSVIACYFITLISL